MTIMIIMNKEEIDKTMKNKKEMKKIKITTTKEGTGILKINKETMKMVKEENK